MVASLRVAGALLDGWEVAGGLATPGAGVGGAAYAARICCVRRVGGFEQLRERCPALPQL